MIKNLFLFIGGFIVASIAYFVFAYSIGMTLESLEISLYASEADQQRNFNIVIILWLFLALIGGWLFAKKYQADKKV